MKCQGALKSKAHIIRTQLDFPLWMLAVDPSERTFYRGATSRHYGVHEFRVFHSTRPSGRDAVIDSRILMDSRFNPHAPRRARQLPF
jgi:hypothetical protein